MDLHAKKLKKFAEDLSSNKFNSNKEIKFEMESLGLKYSEDEIERLNQVLLALHPLSKKIKDLNHKNSIKETTH